MKTLRWCLLALVVGIVGTLVWTDSRLSAYQAAVDTLYVRDTVRLRDSVEVVKWATRTKVQQDTIDITDTVQVREFIYSVDTLRERCMACVASASGVSEAAKHVVVAARPKFRDRIGISAGYGITKIGPNVQAGPQLQVGIRIWP